MARSVNKVTLIGIVGNDVQVNALSSGNSAVNLSIATDESYNDRNTGMKVEQTEWHRVTAFGKLAEIIGQYVRKGSRIYIEGRLRTREWEKDGIKRYTTEIIANEMMMLDRANPGSSPTAGAPMSSGYSGNYQQPQAPQASMQQPVQQSNIPPQGYQAPPQQPMQQPVQPMQQSNPAQNNFANNDGNFDDDIPF